MIEILKMENEKETLTIKEFLKKYNGKYVMRCKTREKANK